MTPDMASSNLRRILDTSPIGLAIVSTTTKDRIFANPKLAEMFGASSVDELLDRKIGESWVDPVQLSLAENIMDSGENLVDFKAHRLRLDGSKWWVLMNSHFTEFEGETARVIWHNDITDIVASRAEIERANQDLETRVVMRTAEIQETEARFRDFAEIASDWFWEMDADLKYTFVSDAYEKITLKPPSNLIGRSRRDMYKGQFPNEAEAWQTYLATLDAHENFDNFTYSYQRDDGVILTLNNSGRAIFDESGTFKGYRGTGLDYTEQYNLRAMLGDQEARFQMIVDLQTDLITRFSPDWKLTFVNRAYCEFVDDTEENLIGSSMFMDVPDNITTALISYFQAFTPDNSIQLNENQIRRHDGEMRDMEWSNFAEFDVNGQVVMYQSVGRDVTEQRRAQKEIILANEKAQIANRAKSNFLSTMSHEIRTPLNGVLGVAQLLMDSDLNSDQRSKVDTILSSGQTLLAIISDVLDMSKIEAGGLEIEEKAFALGNILSTVTLPFMNMVDEKGLNLKVADGLDSDLTLKGDQFRLRQILWNLLSNAVKFTDKGDVTLRIDKVPTSTDAEIEDRDVTLNFIVEDTGRGIADDRLTAIFEPFTQEDDSITRKFGGTGLGLSIVRQLAEIMGGKISVSSQVGEGTQFVVTLPFYKASPDEEKDIQKSTGSETAHPTYILKVLLAEDNPVNAMIAIAFLDKLGHQVRHVENGALAVAAAQENWADLILMDVHMPIMDGIEATTKIRQAEPSKDSLPIIGLTAEAFAERHAQFIEAGMNEVLTKPYTEAQLSETLHRFGLKIFKGETAPSTTDTTDAQPLDQAQAPQTSPLPIIDEQGFALFCSQLSSDIVPLLLTKAQESLRVHLTNLRAGVSSDDPEMVYQAAHAIKGSCGSMFAVRLAALAKDAELQSQDTDSLTALMPQIERAAEETLKEWQRHQP